MKTLRLAALILICAALTIFSAGLAEAANGTLKVTFKYKDSATGVEQNLNYGFIYLHDAARPAPMEKFFSKPDYILGGPASSINGKLTVSVPAGTYYVRLVQRKSLGGTTRPYGPPETGDLSWFQTTPVTITAGVTLDLGTKYASPFGSTITITGTIKNASGTPLPGRYVRAQTVPCYDDGVNNNINQCGPVKIMAQQPTDVNGTYTLELRDPGTYYLYTYSSRNTTPGCGGFCAPPIVGTGYPTYSAVPQPITVQTGDRLTADIVTF